MDLQQLFGLATIRLLAQTVPERLRLIRKFDLTELNGRPCRSGVVDGDPCPLMTVRMSVPQSRWLQALDSLLDSTIFNFGCNVGFEKQNHHVDEARLNQLNYNGLCDQLKFRMYYAMRDVVTLWNTKAIWFSIVAHNHEKR